MKLLKLLFIIVLGFFSYNSFGVAHDTAKIGVVSTYHSGCSSAFVQFHDSSTTNIGPITRRKWVFDNLAVGDTSNAANPSWNYTTQGTYTVKLFIWWTAAGGGIDSMVKTNFVRVTPPTPTLDFVISDSTHNCAPKTVTFYNRSPDTGACLGSYTWYIDTAIKHTTYKRDTVKYTFNNPGDYDIILQESTGCGCNTTKTKTAYVHVDSFPAACFSAPDTLGCGTPHYVHFSNCTSGASTYLWKFGDGSTDTSTNPVHVYTTSSNFNDTLIAYSATGCAKQIQKSNYVRVGNFNVYFGTYYSATATTPTNPFCVNSIVYFRDSTAVLTGTGTFNYHHWRFTNLLKDTFNTTSTLVSRTYPSPGIYRVSDSVWNTVSGCSGVDTVTVVIDSLPILNTPTVFNKYRCGPNDTAMLDTAGLIIDTAGIAKIVWSFGDPATGVFDTAYSNDSTHIYTSSGSYSPTIKVTDKYGCSSSKVFPNLINLAPPFAAVKVDVDSGCIPLTVHYSDSLSPQVSYVVDSVRYSDGSPTDVGIGVTGSHTYTTQGRFMMYHYYHLTDSFGGCSYIDSMQVSAGFSPILSSNPFILPDTVCPSDTVHLRDTCFNCTTKTWITNGGNITDTSRFSCFTDTVIAYQSASSIPTIRNIILVPNVYGCIDTIRAHLYVRPPSVMFSVTDSSCSTVQRNTFKFTNQSVSPLSTYTYRWNFGDGTTLNSNATLIYHTFPHDTTSYIVTLTDTGTYHGVTCHNSFWRFAHVYPVKATTTNFTISKTITCKNSSITFTGPHTLYDSLYKTYEWHFGDKSATVITAGISTTHSYTATGIYLDTLILTNTYGCKDTLRATGSDTITAPGGGVTVGGVLTNATTPLVGCNPFTVTFHDADTAATGHSIVKRRWIWNIGTPSVLGPVPDSTHTFTLPAGNYSTIYSVIRIDSDDLGCTDWDTIKINPQRPHAYFVPLDSVACTNVKVKFHDTTTHCQFYWKFGDGSTDTGLSNPNKPYLRSYSGDTSHIYVNNGTYDDTLLTISDGTGTMPAGCRDSLIIPHGVTIGNSAITASFYLGSTYKTCPNLSEIVTNNSTTLSGSNTTYYRMWKFGTDSTTITAPSLSNVAAYTYTYPGTYTVTLIDSTAIGCKDSTKRSLTIDGPTGTLTFTPDTICAAQSVHLHVSSSSLTAGVDTSFFWAPTGASYTQTDSTGFIFTYPTPGTYHPTVRITHGGCTVTVPSSDSIVVSPKPSIIVPTDTICKGTSIGITATASLPGAYKWLPATGLSCTTCNNPTANPTVTTTYSVIATSNHGCKDTVTTRLEVIQSPTITVTPASPTICKFSSVSLTASGATTYSWSPAATLSCTACSNPVATDSVATTYKVVGTLIEGTMGCKDSTNTTVSIYPHPTVTFHPSVPGVCAMDTNLVSATGITSLTFNPAAARMVNDTGYIVPTISPTETYTVTGIYSGSCIDTVYTTLTVYPKPSLTVSPNTVKCIASTSVLTVSSNPAATYLWSPSSTLSSSTSSSTVASNTDTVTFRVIGTTTAHGCKDSGFVTVAVYPVPAYTITHQFDTICAGTTDSIEITGFTSAAWTPGAGWTWGGPTHDTAITTAAATLVYSVSGGTKVYTVNGTYAASCHYIFSDSIIVKPLPPTPAAITGTATTCPGSFTTLNEAVTGGVWSSSNPAIATVDNTGAVTGISNGTTTIAYTTTNSCGSAVVTKIVTVNPMPNAGSISGGSSVCQSSTLSLTNAATGGTWSSSSLSVATVNASGVVTGVSSGTANIVYTVTNVCGTATASKTITVNPLPIAGTITGTDSFCNGTSILLNDAATGGTWSSVSIGVATVTTGGLVQSVGAGSSVIHYTVINGCGIAVANKTVTVNPLPVLSVTANSTKCISATKTLTVNGAASYVWSPAATLSCSTCATTIASANVGTTYSVIGTTSLGCKDSTTTIVSVYTVPSVTVSKKDTICNMEVDTISVTGFSSVSWQPTVGVTYSSVATQDSAFVHPAATQVYTIVGTYQTTCRDTLTAQVNVISLPSLTITPSQSICKYTTAALSVSGANFYSWSPSATLSCNTCNNPIASNTVSATYSVVGYVQHGCNATATTTVSVYAVPTVVITQRDTICAGARDTVRVVSGMTNVSWTPAAIGYSSLLQDTAYFQPSSTLIDTLIGFYSGTCKDTVYDTINVIQLPALTVSPSTTICKYTSANLTAGGATTYSWSPAATLSCSTCTNPVANPLTAKTYTVVGTGQYGCKDSLTTTVAIYAIPTVTFHERSAICQLETDTISATGISSLTFNPAPSSLVNDTAYANPMTTTIYTVTGLYSAGSCIDTLHTTITVHPRPVITVNPATIINKCRSASATLSVSSNPSSTYIWSPSATLNCNTCSTVHDSAAVTTIYTVTATTTYGCMDSATKTVNVYAIPSVTIAKKDTICIGETDTVSVTGFSSVLWKPTTSILGYSSLATKDSAFIRPLATEVDTLIGTYQGICKDTLTTQINIINLPSITVSPNQSICQYRTALLTAIGANFYSWSPAATLSCSTCGNPTASNTVTTTYKVIGYVQHGCRDSATTTVSVYALPNVTIVQKDTICAGEKDTVNVVSGITNITWKPTPIWYSSSLHDTASFHPLSTMIDTLIGYYSGTCKDTIYDTIHVVQLPALTVSPSTTICRYTTAALTVSGANSYSWTPSATLSCSTCSSPVASNTVNTTYKVIGTVLHGCKDSVTTNVSVYTIPSVTVQKRNAICQLETDTVSFTGINTLTFNPAPVSQLHDTGILNPMATAVYTVTGLYSAGSCIDTVNTTITVHPKPVLTVNPTTVVNKCRSASASLTVSSSTGAAYIWSPAGTLNCSTCATVHDSATVTTTYSVTATTSYGCMDSAAKTVNVYTVPTVTVTKKDTICNGVTDTISVAGFSSAVWNPNTSILGYSSLTTKDSAYAHPSVTQVYTIIGTYQANCKDTLTATVTVIPLPPISVSPNTTICLYSSANLTVTGGSGDTYKWSPSASLSCSTCANPIATPSLTTVYKVVATEPVFGCKDSLNTTVGLYNHPALIVLGKDTVCNGEIDTLSVANMVPFSWNPSTSIVSYSVNNDSAYVQPSVSQTYTITGLYSGVCLDTAYFHVTVISLPNLTVSPAASICRYANTTLSVSGGTHYVWSPASSLSCVTCSSPVATPSVNTVYKVVADTIHGCKDSSSVSVTIFPYPTVVFHQKDTICFGMMDTITVTGISSLTWHPSVTSLSHDSAFASPALTKIYTVTGYYSGTCGDTVSDTITVIPLPVHSVSHATNICIGNSTGLSVAGGSTYQWSPSLSLSCSTCANPTATPTVTTTYKVIVDTIYGCHDSDSTTVSIYNIPTVHFYQKDTICAGEKDTIRVTGLISSTWSPGTGITYSSSLHDTAYLQPAATQVYSISGVYGNGCIFNTTDSVIVVQLPVINVSNDTSICKFSTIPLSATGILSYNYSWSPTTSLSCSTCSSFTASPLSNITYRVTASTLHGCNVKDSVKVTVYNLPVVAFNGKSTICAGEIDTISVTGFTPVSWTPLANTTLSVTADTAFIRPTATQIDTVIGTYSVASCYDTVYKTITVIPLPMSNASSNTSICEYGNIGISVVGGTGYKWSPVGTLSCSTCANPTASPTVTTTYKVVVDTFNGCKDSSFVTVSVLGKPAYTIIAHDSICIGVIDTIVISGFDSSRWSPSSAGWTYISTNHDSVSIKPSATAVYTIYGIYSAAKCIDTIPDTITVVPLPTISVSNDTTICRTGGALLTAAGNSASYDWAPIGSLSCGTCSITMATPTITTLYKVTGTSLFGCKNVDSVKVSVYPRPAIGISGKDSICAGETDTLVLAGLTSSLTWKPSTGLSYSAKHDTAYTKPVVSISYKVVGKYAGKCLDSTTLFKVTVINLPLLSSSVTPGYICNGGLFEYFPTSSSIGTSFNWHRPAVNGITPATSNGSDSISEKLFNNLNIPDTVTYIYNLNFFGCKDSQNVKVAVEATPDIPKITTKSPANLCLETQYQNFGASQTAPSGITYSWTAENATVWAQGQDRQYCLVNFDHSGNAYIILSAGPTGIQCSSADTFVVSVGGGVSGSLQVIADNGYLVCLNNSEDTYQWGFDDAKTLDSTMISGETGQYYHSYSYDFKNKNYWVVATKDGCLQKAYYNTPTGITTVNISEPPVIKAYPNPASDVINVEIEGLEFNNNHSVKIIDVTGKVLKTQPASKFTAFSVADLAQGFYFIGCYDNGILLVSTKFVVSKGH